MISTLFCSRHARVPPNPIKFLSKFMPLHTCSFCLDGLSSIPDHPLISKDATQMFSLLQRCPWLHLKGKIDFFLSIWVVPEIGKKLWKPRSYSFEIYITFTGEISICKAISLSLPRRGLSNLLKCLSMGKVRTSICMLYIVCCQMTSHNWFPPTSIFLGWRWYLRWWVGLSQELLSFLDHPPVYTEGIHTIKLLFAFPLFICLLLEEGSQPRT